MSIGIGAFAKKVAEDKKMVMYEYGGYNLNDPRYRNAEHLSDGTITILKECFVEPEIHKKLKRQLVLMHLPLKQEKRKQHHNYYYHLQEKSKNLLR